jgi:GT2 family glycosyltransferase
MSNIIKRRGSITVQNAKVSIVIVNYNKRELLAECLKSLKDKTEYGNYRVIIVDNGSKDGSVDMIRAKFSWVDLIENKGNLGFSQANNVGIKYALKKHHPDFILLLNNDTKIVQSTWLKNLVREATSDERIGIVGCKFLNPDGSVQYSHWRYKPVGVEYLPVDKLREDVEVDYVGGACILIKTEVVNKIGLLDEKFSPVFYEETDYCFRARQSGFKVIFTPKCEVIHYGGATVKEARHFFNFVFRRNRIRFMLLSFPLTWIIARIPHEVIMFLRNLSLASHDLKLGQSTYKLSFLIKTYIEVFKDAKSVLHKRRSRTEKLWY